MTHVMIFTEIDDVLANVSARMALAERRANEMAAAKGRLTQREWNDIKWETFFSPEHIALDQYMTESREALDALEAHTGAEVILLTSRKEQCRIATMAWLAEYGLYLPESQSHQARRLVMKSVAFSENATKTAIWKAGTIPQIASSEGASRVLAIEPLAHIREEVERYYTPYPIDVFSSLAEALAIVEVEAKRAAAQEDSHADE